MMLLYSKKLTDEEVREEVAKALAGCDRSLSGTDGVPETGDNDE